MHLQVREMALPETELMIRYFLEAGQEYLRGMGTDPAKFPDASTWSGILAEDFAKPLQEKSFYYLIWECDGTPVGHSNINKIRFGTDAFMHLHLWQPQYRRQGIGAECVRQSIPWYFDRFDLRDLYAEPYAENPAPNHTFPKAGFELVKSYTTVPGWINFEQQVNRWQLSRDRFESLYGRQSKA